MAAAAVNKPGGELEARGAVFSHLLPRLPHLLAKIKTCDCVALVNIFESAKVKII